MGAEQMPARVLWPTVLAEPVATGGAVPVVQSAQWSPAALSAGDLALACLARTPRLWLVREAGCQPR